MLIFTVGTRTSLRANKTQKTIIKIIPQNMVKIRLIVSTNLKEKNTFSCRLVSNDKNIKFAPIKADKTLFNDIESSKY